MSATAAAGWLMPGALLLHFVCHCSLRLTALILRPLLLPLLCCAAKQQKLTQNPTCKHPPHTSCLQQPGETVRSQVLESLGCWLKLSGGAGLPAGLPDSPLVAAALEGLKVDGTFDAAVDAVRR